LLFESETNSSRDHLIWACTYWREKSGILAISINQWWKTRYPEFKMRIVSKKAFEHIKMQEQQLQQ